jgi:hypothetical protein
LDGPPASQQQVLPPEVFRPPAPWVIKISWALFVLGGILEILSAGMYYLLGVPFFLPLIVILFIDTYRINCNKLRFTSLKAGALERYSSGQWLFAFLLPPTNLVYIPAYLRIRNAMAYKSYVTQARGLYLPKRERDALNRRLLTKYIVVVAIILAIVGLAVWAVILGNEN